MSFRPQITPNVIWCGHPMTSLNDTHGIEPTSQHAFQCSVCRHTAYDENALKIHTDSHKQAQPYTCTICLKSFMHKKQLKYHKSFHSMRDLEFSCPFCSFLASTEDAILLHKCFTHPQECELQKLRYNK